MRRLAGLRQQLSLRSGGRLRDEFAMIQATMHPVHRRWICDDVVSSVFRCPASSDLLPFTPRLRMPSRPMLGQFQQCELRLEVEASASTIAHLLQLPGQWRQWQPPLPQDDTLPDRLVTGTVYRRAIGPLAIEHRVYRADDDCLGLLLSGGVDGYHEWRWGTGWIQSRLEGVSALPLRLVHSLSLQALCRAIERASSDRGDRS